MGCVKAGVRAGAGGGGRRGGGGGQIIYIGSNSAFPVIIGFTMKRPW